MEERERFVILAKSDRYSITELSEQFGISRKTGHKWIKRYEALGRAGLQDHSRAPKNVTNKTEANIERLIIREKRHHPAWGPKKIHHLLSLKHGIEIPPAVSTVGEVLKRHGLVAHRKRRLGVYHVERKSLTEAKHSNHVYAADYKGWFRTQDGERCEPLTISDLYSRYVLKAEALPQSSTKWTQRAFRNLFRRHGLPEIIRVDNGTPFASMGPGGLSRLSVWWLSLGIEVQFTRPGCPQDNGCHERMHRSMQQECCKKPSRNIMAQQQKLERWRKCFNEERPHEALGMDVPAQRYQSSSKRLSEALKISLYEPHEETYRVQPNGSITYQGKRVHVGEAFDGQEVVVEDAENPAYKQVRFANVKVGYIDPEDSSPKARLQPTAYADRWESKACKTNLNNED